MISCRLIHGRHHSYNELYKSDWEKKSNPIVIFTYYYHCLIQNKIRFFYSNTTIIIYIDLFMSR